MPCACCRPLDEVEGTHDSVVLGVAGRCRLLVKLSLLFLIVLLMSPVLTWAGKPPPQESAQQKEDEEDEKKVPWLWWEEGLRLEPGFGNLRVKFGGQAQNDTAGFAGGGNVPVDLENGVVWRRVRFYAQGTFAKRWGFKFQWGFVGGNRPNLQDAFLRLEFTFLKQRLRLRGGRFTTTFGLENEGSSNDTIFMEQGLTSAFVPPQETGVLVHSETSNKRWDFSFSSGADEIQCLICDVVGVSARYSMGINLGREDRLAHFGGNYSRRWTDSATNYAVRPESYIAPVFVDTGPIPAERVDTGLVEGAFIQGPFSLQGEYVVAGVKQPDELRSVFYTFYVFGSYALTGEMRQYREDLGTIHRIRSKHEFRDGSGGIGAFEVALRFSRIDLNDGAIIGGTLNDLSFALNWYPTYPTRVSFNVIRAKREAWDPVWIFQGRLQVAY